MYFYYLHIYIAKPIFIIFTYIGVILVLDAMHVMWKILKMYQNGRLIVQQINQSNYKYGMGWFQFKKCSWFV